MALSGRGKGAAIMINSNQGEPLKDEIKDAVAREYDWPNPDTEISAEPLPKAVDGVYQTENGVVCEVTSRGAVLMVSANNLPPAPFVRKNTEFVSESVNASLEFLPSVGDAASVILRQFGKIFRFGRQVLRPTQAPQ
jgi:hypothetical protein